ncbi:MAG: MFS transporter [Verrucomicrobia bacterium]|nr:MFS transporter [Verrucomicrobiota bacterium]
MDAAPKLIGNNPVYERWRWQVFAITWLAYAGFYLTRKSFAVAKIDMGKSTSLGLTDTQMSWIDGSFLTVYAAGQLFAGICGDRYGTRKVILAGMLGSVLAAVAMGATSLVVPLVILSGLQGLCQSSGWAPLTKNIGCFFSQRERGTVMGLWCTNYAVGGFVASIFAGSIGGWLGWRYAFYGPAATLLIIWILFLWLQRNRPEDVGLPPIEQYHAASETPAPVSKSEAEELDGSWKSILEVLRNPMVLLLSAVYFFMKPTRYAIMFWAPKYLNDKLGTNMAQSGALGALFELAGPLSAFAAGLISDKIFGSRRIPISVFCLLISAVLVYSLDKLPGTKLMLGLCLFLTGFMLFAPDSLISGTAAIDFGAKKGASTAAGLINSCGSIGAIAGGTIPGFLHERWGWNGVFVFLSVSLLIAGLLLLPKWNALPSDKKG